MMVKRRGILLIRHRDAAERTAFKLENLGFRSVILPLSNINLLTESPPEGCFDGVLLTSPVAVRVLKTSRQAEALASLPLYCVGQYTAQVAKEAGFTRIDAIEADASSLAGQLEKQKTGSRLLYACAKHHSFDFETHLRSFNIECRNWEIYSNTLISPDQDQLIEALEITDTLFLFSQRVTSHFFSLIEQNEFLASRYNKHINIAISDKVGRSVPRKFLANTYIAKEKSEQGMIDCLADI